jgi:hypothetical protein
LISLATAGLATNKEVPESIMAESREIPSDFPLIKTSVNLRTHQA